MGLLDFDLSPQQLGLLGMAGQMGNAFAPQAASRLPLARPNAAHLLSQAASGLGGGYGAGLQQQQMKAATTGKQIENLNSALNYNLWAPFLGQQPIPSGAPGMTGQGVAPPEVQMPGAPGAAPPAGGQIPPNAPPAGGGVPSPMAMPGQGGAPPGAPAPNPGGGMDMHALYSLPPPLLQRMGIPVPPELTAAFLAGVQPGTPTYQTLVSNLAMKGAGINPTFGGDRAGVPLQQNSIDPATGKVNTSIVPGSLDAMSSGAFTQAQATGMGGLGSKEAEASFKAGLDVRVADENERRKAFYQTGTMPPPATGSAPPIQGPKGEIGTDRGTVVPPAPAQPFHGTDALLKQNANTAEAEKNFGQIRQSLDGTEARMVGLADALRQVQGNGLNEHRAEIANNLRGIGMTTLADKVLSEKETGAVQKAMGLQTLEVLGQLKQINAGTGGRILNSEFQNLLERQYGPDLTPEANFDLMKTALGGIYQTRNMIDDYYKYGKPGGWRDANAFVSSYYSQPQNSYSAMTSRAGEAIGALKGMAPLKTPTVQAVQHLQMNPDLAPQFDQYYGRGYADRILRSNAR